MHETADTCDRENPFDGWYGQPVTPQPLLFEPNDFVSGPCTRMFFTLLHRQLFPSCLSRKYGEAPDDPSDKDRCIADYYLGSCAVARILEQLQKDLVSVNPDDTAAPHMRLLRRKISRQNSSGYGRSIFCVQTRLILIGWSRVKFKFKLCFSMSPAVIFRFCIKRWSGFIHAASWMHCLQRKSKNADRISSILFFLFRFPSLISHTKQTLCLNMPRY